MATPAEIAAGEAALQAWLDENFGFETDFVPATAELQGASLVIQQWDATQNYADCGQALYQAISKAGYGGEVTQAQCQQAAAAIIAPVLTLRSASR
jgi:hypothetical protein